MTTQLHILLFRVAAVEGKESKKRKHEGEKMEGRTAGSDDASCASAFSDVSDKVGFLGLVVPRACRAVSHYSGTCKAGLLFLALVVQSATTVARAKLVFLVPVVPRACRAVSHDSGTSTAGIHGYDALRPRYRRTRQRHVHSWFSWSGCSSPRLPGCDALRTVAVGHDSGTCKARFPGSVALRACPKAVDDDLRAFHAVVASPSLFGSGTRTAGVAGSFSCTAGVADVAPPVGQSFVGSGMRTAGSHGGVLLALRGVLTPVPGESVVTSLRVVGRTGVRLGSRLHLRSLQSWAATESLSS